MRRYEGIWTKRQWVPIWVLQIIALGVFAAASCVLLAAAHYLDDDNTTYYGYTGDELAHYAQITGAVILTMCAVTFIFLIAEVVLYKRRTLSPVVVLVFAVLETGAWGAYFVLCIIAAATGSFGWLDTLLSLVLFATGLTQLIQSAKLVHQKRKGRLPGAPAGPNAAHGYYQPAYTGAGGLEAGNAAPAAHLAPNNNNYYYGGPPQSPAYRSASPAPSYHAGAYGEQGTEMETRKTGQHQGAY